MDKRNTCIRHPAKTENLDELEMLHTTITIIKTTFCDGLCEYKATASTSLHTCDVIGRLCV